MKLQKCAISCGKNVSITGKKVASLYCIHGAWHTPVPPPLKMRSRKIRRVRKVNSVNFTRQLSLVLANFHNTVVTD